MKNLIPLFLSAFLFTACSNKPVTYNNENKHDTVVIIHRDTVVVTQREDSKQQAKEPPISVQLRPLAKEKKTVIFPTQQKIAKNELANDTTYHYYINKRVSVKITPWNNAERWVLLFNLQEEETYRQKEVRKSYTERAELKFHPNGAVSEMEIHSNPGASMYWYETTITFGSTNDPLQKISERKPQEKLELNKPWEYWDNKSKQWRKQEVQE